MRRILIPLCLLLFSAPSFAAPFDGDWAVSWVCADTSDGASGYTFQFEAKVENGSLHGEHGRPGESGYLTLEGSIAEDGSAQLQGEGLTGNPAYSVKRVHRMTPYTFSASAHFDATTGSGQRTTTRPCDLAFRKH